MATGALAQSKQATVKLEAARKTAQQKVPDGTITSEELEQEHGKLIYSFEMKEKGKSGVEEVNVDAKTGKIVSVEHESARQEKAEAREDAASKTQQ